MALQTSALLLQVISLYGTIVLAQDTPLRIYTGMTEEMELAELSNLQKLDVAAKTGDSHIIRLTAASQSAVAQEGVNLNIDCFPWLSIYPGGTIQWTFIQLDEFGNPVDPNAAPQELVRNEDDDPLPRIVVGGEFNRWLNISRTTIVQGAEDPDRRIFMCEVCVARGTPFEQCHTSNYTSRLIGSPPIIIPESDNFCISRGEMAILECGVSEGPPLALPTPLRSWLRNDVLVYTAVVDEQPVADDFIMNNTIVMVGVLTPQVFVLTADGAINFQTAIQNITLPGLIPDITTNAEAEEEVFQFLLATWTCEAANELGTARISYTVRECGPLPVIPDCSASFPNGVVFPDSGDVLSPGCSVCIQEGSVVTLDCTVSVGDPPISYNWMDAMNNTISQTPRLSVRQPGQYSCTASNLDESRTTETSVLFFSPRAELKTSIVGRSNNGCERLRLNETEKADFQNINTCIFLEETINVSCTSPDPMAELVIFTADDPSPKPSNPYTMVVTDVNVDDVDTTFICQIMNTDGPCGEFQFTSIVRVFDPARIDRTVPLTDPSLGAGRSEDVIQQNNGTTVILECPTSGITEETTNWRRIVENRSDGCLVEVDIDNLPEPQRSRHSVTDGIVNGLNNAILTISPFTFDEEGTYVCRTENIAGVDADVVSLIASEGSPFYTMSEFSECNINCRDGVRNRSVVCRNNRDLRVIPEFRCELDTQLVRPASSVSCADRFPGPCFLDPIWVPYQWSACTGGCKGGYRTRDVLCQVPMTGVTKPSYFCNNLVRPASFEFCPITCCVRDEYPLYCKLSGSSRCNEHVFQQFCCWTCGLRDIP